MTDGLYIDTTPIDYKGGPGVPTDATGETTCPTPTVPGPLDLSTFDAWIAIQLVEVSIDLLYRIAADLAANKGWSGVAFEVRRAADDLKTLTRHGGS